MQHVDPDANRTATSVRELHVLPQQDGQDQRDSNHAAIDTAHIALPVVDWNQALRLASDGFATLAEGQRYLGIGRTKFWEIVKKENFPVIRIGGRKVLPWRVLQEYAARQLLTQLHQEPNS